jgi:hypothetical protein
MISRTAMTARTSIARMPKRNFSSEGHINRHHHPEASFEEISKMRMASYAAFAFCAVAGIGIIATEDHSHKHHPQYPYMRIRKKAFPWKNGDCDLICDSTCERAGKAATSAH